MRPSRTPQKKTIKVIVCENPDCKYDKTPATQNKCNYCGKPFTNKEKVQNVTQDLLLKTIIKEFRRHGITTTPRNCFTDEEDGSVCLEIPENENVFYGIFETLLKKYNIVLIGLDDDEGYTNMWFKKLEMVL